MPRDLGGGGDSPPGPKRGVRRTLLLLSILGLPLAFSLWRLSDLTARATFQQRGYDLVPEIATANESRKQPQPNVSEPTIANAASAKLEGAPHSFLRPSDFVPLSLDPQPTKLFAEATGSAKLLLDEAQTPRTIPDDIIDPAVEEARCKRYHLKYSGRTARRRVFYGSNIADDSWHVISASAMENYGIFHTVAFIESNRTQNHYPRNIRFGPDSEGLEILQGGMYGPNATVTVDYYYNEVGWPKDLGYECAQHAFILERWKKNGMRRGDIGYLADVDEMISRDYLRAMQICDVKEFDAHGNCRDAIITARSVVFEGGPKCLTHNRIWGHPNLIPGECLEGVGDASVHPEPERTWKGPKGEWRGIGWLDDGWQKRSGFRALPQNATHFPLLNGADFRRMSGQSHGGTGHTGFHLHNFFPDAEVLRTKYLTYGHPVKGALEMPLADVHEDIRLMMACTLDGVGARTKYSIAAKPMNEPLPIAFQVPGYVEGRTAELREFLQLEGKSDILEPTTANATSAQPRDGQQQQQQHFLRPPDFVPLSMDFQPTKLFADAEGSAKELLSEAQTPRTIPDDIIDPAVEEVRCKRYNLKYSGRKTRRRVFYGSNIADDSWHVISVGALENYGIFHTVAFVESNRTQMRHPRSIRFGLDSESLNILRGGMYGPNTTVTVDFYYNEIGWPRGIGYESAQHALILDRWKKNGMQPDDIGYLADVDEMFSRDYLRAMQICDVKQFDEHGNCKDAILRAQSLNFEGGPLCLSRWESWGHPGLIVGECLEGIGDASLHPEPERTWKGPKGEWRGIGWLDDGWTKGSGFRKLPKNATHFPLHNGPDYRRARPTGPFWTAHRGPFAHTGFHIHNFFANESVLRHKYNTFGHPVKGALEIPLGEIHEDLKAMIDCSRANSTTPEETFALLKGPLPLAFQITGYIEARTAELKEMLWLDKAD
ncbi:hypothetical protein ACHAXT_001650 [Thalassiosira profunda]